VDVLYVGQNNHMRFAIYISAAFMFLTSSSWAFDPVGPPPSTSLSITVAHVTHVKVARVDYPDGPLLEVLDWIRVIDIPVQFGVTIDASQLDRPESRRVKLVAKDLTILEAAAKVAEQLDAEILIQPGKICLVPKAQNPKKTKPNKP
jgi:hypothetical protein